MKKIFIFITALLIVNTSFGSFVATKAEEKPAKKEQTEIAVREMRGKGYEKLTAKKVSFIERFIFKLEKKLFKKYDDETEGFNLGGFALGFFFLPVGVGLAYLFSHDSNFKKWTWIGFGAGVILLGLLYVAVSSIVVVR